MFIKDSAFKSLVKKAYKNEELDIERQGDMIAIRTGWWHLQCMESFLSNKAKASLIELIGDLPEAGKAMQYGDGCDPQLAMPYTIFDQDVSRLLANCTVEYKPTRVLLQGGETTYIMLQNAKKEKVLVDRVFIDLMDFAGIDEENGETVVNMNPLGEEDSSRLIYYTNSMILVFHTHPVRYKKTKQILQQLEDTDCVWNMTEDERLD